MRKSLRLFALAITITMLLSIPMISGCGNTEDSTTTTKAATNDTESEGTTEGSSDNEAVTISILTAQGSYRAEAFTAMAEKMKEKYNYTIDFQVLPDDQYYVLARAKVATNEVPDIIEYNTPSNNIELGATENCVPLNDQPWVDRLVNPDLLQDPNDGNIYAMPRDSGSFFGAAYYNKALLEELGVSTEQPATMDEFIARLQEIKDKSNGEVTPLYATNADSWTTQVYMTLGFAVYNYPDDTDIFNKLLKNELTFSDAPGFKEVMSQYKSFYDLGLVNKDHLSASYEMAKEALPTGKAAVYLNGEWYVSDAKAKYPDAKFGAWAIPYNDELMIGTGAYVRGWFAMKGGSQIDKTLEFMDRWSQPEIMNIFFEDLPGFPAFEDVDGGEVDPSVQGLIDDYISTGKYTYQINDPMGVASSIWTELWKLYIDMVAQDIPPQDTMDQWQQIYADYMKQNEQPGF
jgi:raffinose/stachyose/melibiose transport system substrate-binding protein